MADRRVGDRVQDADGARGRVRYVGPVASSRDAAAVYYGVEWDAWGRGRNDGSVEAASGERVRYFDGPAPRRGQFRCSFVKASKLAAPRVSLLDRLLERYGDGDSSAGRVPVDPNDVVVSGEVGTALGSQKPIELVGVNKLRTQQTLQTIEKISLAGCQIESLGGTAPGELAALAPSISELDLSSNLLPSWDAVFEIAAELPLLSTLILNGNRLACCTSDLASRTKYRFENIKVLVLNQTATPWNELLSVLEHHFPSLTELHVADNEYSDNDLPGFSAAYKQARPSWMETLEVLDLSMNRFQSWALLHETLGTAMPKLRQLMVNTNAIQSLVVPKPRPEGFIQLQSLSVTENLIDSWSSIDELNMYPRLDTLRFSKNPLTAQMGVGEVRMIIVARTDRVSVFNSSEVPAKERQDCEQLYLKRILHELAVVGDSPAEKAHILSTHPRFETLKELYPEISASFANGGSSGVSTGPAKLGSSLISVKIVPFSMQATTFDPLVKKIPEKMKISQLKLLVEKKFGLETTAQMLTLSMGSKSIPIPLDDDNSEIGYYGLQDGAEIFVNDV